jgi:hypothetical protein
VAGAAYGAVAGALDPGTALAIALAAGVGALAADLAAAVATRQGTEPAAGARDGWAADALAATLPVLLAAVPAYLVVTVALA